MNVSLTPKLEEYVRQKVESGYYNNASEVVREALRRLAAQEGGAPANKETAGNALQKTAVLTKLLQLEQPLRKRGLSSLALFGSFVHGTARPESDVDVLIQVVPKKRFSLIDLLAVKNFLEEQLGRAVDVVTRDSLDPHIRDRVLREAQQVF